MWRRLFLAGLSAVCALPAVRGADPPDRIDVEVRGQTYPEAIRAIFAAAGERYRLEESAAAALPQTPVTLLVRKRSVRETLDVLFKILPDNGQGIGYARRDGVWVIRKNPVRRNQVEVLLPPPELPALWMAGPLRLSVLGIETADRSQITVRFEAEWPELIHIAVGGHRNSVTPSVRLKSGRVVRIEGRSSGSGSVRTIAGTVDAPQDDPPAAVVWDVRWWEP